MGQGKRRVLLVDDEASIVKTIGKRLEVAGYDVIIAVDGQEAIEKTYRDQPDILVLDLVLPKLSGLEVCETLKRDPRSQHIPIIIFTGKGEEKHEELCRRRGADAYLTQPRASMELVKQIELLLNKAPRPDQGPDSSAH